MPSILYTYQSLTNLTPDLADIASLGVKVVMNYYYTKNDANTANVIAYLNALEAANLKGCVSLSGLAQADAETIVTAVKDHAALWGYYLYDEPTTDIPAGTYATLYDAIKAVDPARPILGVYPGYGAGFFPDGDGRTAYTLSSDNQDIFGIDTYPVSNAGGYDESTFRTHVRAARSSVPADVTRLMFALQTFIFVESSTSPTPAQLAAMETVVREEGWTTAGVLFFIWDVDTGLGSDVDDAFCLKQNTGLWDGVRKIATAYTSRDRSLPFLADQFAEGFWTEDERTLASGSASAPTDLNEFVAQEVWTADERTAGMADVTAPTVTDPTVTVTGTTTADLTVTTDEDNGTLYVVVTTSNSPPSAAQVVALQNHVGGAPTFGDTQVITTTGTKTIPATGLSAGTTYYAYFVHEDAAANKSTVASSDPFTTDSEGVPGVGGSVAPLMAAYGFGFGF